jgi:tRNA threonylcarbamoyladenosine biosynthesis protein TsaE
MDRQAFATYLPDEQATLRMGQILGHEVKESGAARCLLLRGAPGSGKTTLIRGLVNALPGGDIAETASPSFSLCNWYDTVPPVLHADVFRCCAGNIPEELEEALSEAVPGGRILVIVEWAENLSYTLRQKDYLDIFLHTCDEGRLFLITASGEASLRTVEALRVISERKMGSGSF